MKTKEFNLSEKEMICCENMNGMFIYPSKHVKEFIKIDDDNLVLLQTGTITWNEYWNRRTELAGKELLE